MRKNHLTVSVCENIAAIQFKVQKPNFIDLCEKKKPDLFVTVSHTIVSLISRASALLNHNQI